MAQYMILIYEQESPELDTDPALWEASFEAHSKFAGQVGEHGATLLGGNALEPSAAATSVRGDVVTDGPFAETKEVLGGYYLIDARDLDHALQIAKLCPAPRGGVEVRPVMDTSVG
jgi:hypothetical protein